MAFNKAHTFDATDYDVSLLCKALSHPARIAVVRQLMKQGKMRASELGKALPLSQPAVSQHLKLLHAMQIVDREEVYPNVYYWMNEALSEHYVRILSMIMGNEK